MLHLQQFKEKKKQKHKMVCNKMHHSNHLYKMYAIPILYQYIYGFPINFFPYDIFLFYF